MSSTVMPWSIKGISAEARGVAKTAAGAANQSIGPWLSQLIRAASRAEHEATTGQALVAADPAPLPASGAAELARPDWRSEIETLTDRIAKLEQRAAALVGPLDHAVDRISRRLHAIEARPSLQEKPGTQEKLGTAA